jgi:hypothetical protein
MEQDNLVGTNLTTFRLTCQKLKIPGLTWFYRKSTDDTLMPCQLIKLFGKKYRHFIGVIFLLKLTNPLHPSNAIG